MICSPTWLLLGRQERKKTSSHPFYFQLLQISGGYASAAPVTPRVRTMDGNAVRLVQQYTASIIAVGATTKNTTPKCIIRYDSVFQTPRTKRSCHTLPYKRSTVRYMLLLGCGSTTAATCYFGPCPTRFLINQAINKPIVTYSALH